MSLTVSELLALEGTLRPCVCGRESKGCSGPVRWYYVAENEHIAEWIMGGELVFITGINHPRDEANLIQLLMEGKQRRHRRDGDPHRRGLYPRHSRHADRPCRRAGHSAD